MAISAAAKNQAEAEPAHKLSIAVAGFGTVGSAVARILSKMNGNLPLQLTHVYNRGVQRKKVDWVPPEVCWTQEMDEVMASGADVLVELVGGLQPAYEWVHEALTRGKSVVTANKQLIAHHGPELAELAHRSGRVLAFGAAVAGGVPVLDALHEGLAGDRLYRVCGVLNGTCNYILTNMENAGKSFEDALREAQQAGFAEADPTDDVDGYDARAKLVILARLGLHAVIKPSDVMCRSIRDIGIADFHFSHQLGCTVRQVSRVELRDARCYAAVQPALVPRESPLAELIGGQNLVISTGEFGGDTVFSGHGAGGNPTAVAVVSDLLSIARLRPYGRARGQYDAPPEYQPSADFVSPWYLRFVVRDRPGIVAALASVLARHEINISALMQRERYDKNVLPLVITLEECSASRVDAAVREMETLDFHEKRPLSLPILQ